MKAILKTLATVLLLLPLVGTTDYGELIVIASPGLIEQAPGQSELRAIFRGEQRELAGREVRLVDLPERHPAREAFYPRLTGRTVDQMAATWARRVFTGQGFPPRELSNEHAVIQRVLGRDDTIGYLPAEYAEEVSTAIVLRF